MPFSRDRVLVVPLLLGCLLLCACGGGVDGGAVNGGDSSGSKSASKSSPPCGSLPRDKVLAPASGTARYFAYVQGYDIAAYSINADTGVLIPVGIFSGDSTFGMSVHPNGKFAYLLSATDITTYTINAFTGALASVGSPVPVGFHPSRVTLHPNGRFAYLTYGIQTNDNDLFGISTFAINPDTGLLSSVGTRVSPGPVSALGPIALTISPSSSCAYVSTARSITLTLNVDIETGAVSLDTAAALLNEGQGGGFTMAPNGKFAYYIHGPPQPTIDVTIRALFINQDTGALIPSGEAYGGKGGFPVSILFDQDSKFLYLTSDSNILSYTINQETGAVIPMATISVGTDYVDFLAEEPTGRFVYAMVHTRDVVTVSRILTYSIDANSGSLTSVGDPIVVPNARYMYTVRTLE
jgi:6-phosphogluconolactonase (cycloisomerase 2 family)